MKWSVDGQTPEFLEVTRIVTLSASVLDVVMSHLALRPGMKVLEVGCGTGEYSFRLGARLHDMTFVGLDLDDSFIAYAKAKVCEHEAEQPSNTYQFVCGSGCELPFDDNSFDAVISHTYLTAVPDYKTALSELARVCKPGGQVSSVTAMFPDFCSYGRFSLLPQYRFMSQADAAVVNRVASLCALRPTMDCTAGIPTWDVQNSFQLAGLEEVHAAPLGQYFCLSDARVTAEEYNRFVGLLYQIEVQGADALRGDADIAARLDEREWEEYYDYLARRRDDLLAMQGRNPEWDWYGSASLLVCGVKSGEPKA